MCRTINEVIDFLATLDVPSRAERGSRTSEMPDADQTDDQRRQAEIIVSDVFYGGIPAINEALAEAGLPMVLSEEDFFDIFGEANRC